MKEVISLPTAMLTKVQFQCSKCGGSFWAWPADYTINQGLTWPENKPYMRVYATTCPFCGHHIVEEEKDLHKDIFQV